MEMNTLSFNNDQFGVRFLPSIARISTAAVLILGPICLCCGACPVLCGTLHSILASSPLRTRRALAPPRLWQWQMSLDIAERLLGTALLTVENHWSLPLQTLEAQIPETHPLNVSFHVKPRDCVRKQEPHLIDLWPAQSPTRVRALEILDGVNFSPFPIDFWSCIAYKEVWGFCNQGLLPMRLSAWLGRERDGSLGKSLYLHALSLGMCQAVWTQGQAAGILISLWNTLEASLLCSCFKPGGKERPVV